MSIFFVFDGELGIGVGGMGMVKGYDRKFLFLGLFKKSKEKYRYLSIKLGDSVYYMYFKRIRNRIKIFFKRKNLVIFYKYIFLKWLWL